MATMHVLAYCSWGDVFESWKVLSFRIFNGLKLFSVHSVHLLLKWNNWHYCGWLILYSVPSYQLQYAGVCCDCHRKNLAGSWFFYIVVPYYLLTRWLLLTKWLLLTAWLGWVASEQCNTGVKLITEKYYVTV